MADDLPKLLISAVQDGRAVLMLGAGASFGSIDPAGTAIPSADDLASEIVAKFLTPEYAKMNFRIVYDLACSERDVRTVQKFVHDRLLPFQPADFHHLLPTFNWAGLLTTNYDLIVERAYEAASKKAVQRLVVHRKDADDATSLMNEMSVLYVKLHGCLTLYEEVSPPMVASTEQLIAFRNGRVGQFDTFLEWSRLRTLIFVGYSFQDPNLRQLVDELVKEGDNRPRHYVVDPFMLPAMANYWTERRIAPVRIGFKALLESLNIRITSTARTLGALSGNLQTTSFTRYISVSGQRESDDLVHYLKFSVDHVTEHFEVKEEEPKKFYQGFDLGWYTFANDLDVKRAVGDDILGEHVITDGKVERPRLIVLKGHAGSGKSVTLRRICWDAARSFDKFCIFVSASALLKPELIAEMLQLTNQSVYVFVDGLASHRSAVRDLLRLPRTRSGQVTIVGTETYNVWNASCETLEPYVTADYEMKPLSGTDIKSLLKKLEEHDSLGKLKRKPRNDWETEFRVAFGRQILVALLEVTHGLPLVEIILREYESIYPPEARALYLDICSLNRFGQPVRAGLISRIHNLSFADFETDLFKPLEQIVRLRKDERGDYVYEARHPQIAHELYELVLKTVDERFDNFARIITKLNPSFSYDLEVISRLIRAENVANAIRDPNRGRQIYDIALESLGRLPIVLHQRGIYEVRIANNLGTLKKAAEWIDEAIHLEPWNKIYKHSLSELDLKRSRISTEPLERRSWRRSAISQASSLTLGGKSPYPFHTIIKATTDEVEDLLALVEEEETEANVRELGEAIAAAEDTLKRGLELFPADTMLLSGEGNLAEVLSKATRAESAFRKALASNPRSTLVARRLVKVLNAKGDVEGTISVLRNALTSNPANSEMHFDLAMALMQVGPDADQSGSTEILYHLRRSFTPGDRSYQHQFWYARELCLDNRYEDARPLFEALSDAPISHSSKVRLQGPVMDARGQPKQFGGSVTTVKPLFGFVRPTDLSVQVFFSIHSDNSSAGRPWRENEPVSFNMTFNYKGPVATNITRTSVV